MAETKKFLKGVVGGRKCSVASLLGPFRTPEEWGFREEVSIN